MKNKNHKFAFSLMEIICVSVVLIIVAVVVWSIRIKSYNEENAEIAADLRRSVEQAESANQYSTPAKNYNPNAGCDMYDARCLLLKYRDKNCQRLSVVRIGEYNKAKSCYLYIKSDQIAIIDDNGINRLIGYGCQTYAANELRCELYSVYGTEMKCFDSNFREIYCK